MKRWTEKEDDYLRNFYADCGVHPKTLGRDLGRSERATKARIKLLNLSLPPRDKEYYWPDED